MARASEWISYLQGLINAHGDKPVTILDNDGLWTAELPNPATGTGVPRTERNPKDGPVEVFLVYGGER